MSGAQIRAEIAAALAEAGAEVGTGPFRVSLIRGGATTRPFPDQPVGPGNMPITTGAAQTWDLLCVEDVQTTRDMAGNMMAQSQRVLTVEAGIVEPLKSDVVEVQGIRHRIAEVVPLAPAGEALLYELRLEV